MAFGLKTEQVEVVVHPQSIVHSLKFQFEEMGLLKPSLACLICVPIQFAAGYPERLSRIYRVLIFNYPALTFEAGFGNFP